MALLFSILRRQAQAIDDFLSIVGNFCTVNIVLVSLTERLKNTCISSVDGRRLTVTRHFTLASFEGQVYVDLRLLLVSFPFI